MEIRAAGPRACGVSGRRPLALSRPGERLLLRAREGGEAARQLEQPPLPGARPGGLALVQVLEEVARLDPERPRDGMEPAGRDPVHALLVLELLLVGDPGVSSGYERKVVTRDRLVRRTFVAQLLSSIAAGQP